MRSPRRVSGCQDYHVKVARGTNRASVTGGGRTQRVKRTPGTDNEAEGS